MHKSVPRTFLVVWHSWTVAHAYGFLLTGSFWLSRPNLLKENTCKHLLPCGKSSNSQCRSATSTIALIISIAVHQRPSNRFRGRCCRTDFRERRAIGTRKAHVAREEKTGFLFQRMSGCRPSCGETPCKAVSNLASACRRQHR